MPVPRAAAALAGDHEVAPEHAAMAVALVLAPRATRVPAPPAEETDDTPPPPAEAQEAAPDEDDAQDAPPPDAPQDDTNSTEEEDAPGALDDRLIEEVDCMVVMLCASTLNDSRSCELLRAQLKSAHDDLPVWFVLVHEAGWVEQSVVERIRKEFGSGFKLLHVRRGHHSDNARTARHVLGLTLGLVLGGGGARGFAHAGFFQALEEAGVVVDSVGGTSMGALVGALISSGRSSAEVNKALATSASKSVKPLSVARIFPGASDALHHRCIDVHRPFKIKCALRIGKVMKGAQTT